MMMRNKYYYNRSIYCIMLVVLFATFSVSCQKVEYTEMDSPAYLRVFNSLNLFDIMGSGVQDSLPYLCMLINPTFDLEGNPNGAEIIGDFLDRRDNYAPPYPVNIGVSTSKNNVEYPGKEPVLCGPILNGYDLSSWAQVPSGKMHILFMYRPKNETPFFELAKQYRINKAVESELDLQKNEVYTLNVIYDNFDSRSKKIILRSENFHKIPLSDSLVYANFYNYTAEGYSEADISIKFPPGRTRRNFFEGGIKDNMDVYLTIWHGQDYYIDGDGVSFKEQPVTSPFYDRKYIYTLRRNHETTKSTPYISFPLWTKDINGDKVYTNSWQQFEFVSSQVDLSRTNNTFHEDGRSTTLPEGGPLVNSEGHYAIINCLLNGQTIYTSTSPPKLASMGLGVPNLIVNTHSGKDNPRSFASVNTFEVINGNVYLMTLQRKYAPPLY